MSVIKEFYKDKTLLITGGTGVMGKVLLVKLLRSLPEIKIIYILLRPKRGVTPAERIVEMTSKMPFTLNGLGESNFKKIVAIQGDITKKDLGLSGEDKIILINEVSIVFHLAASVRMNMSLKDAIIQNTLATLRLFEMCTEMKKLVSVVHLSTAYCNVEIDYMEEKIYKIDVEPLQMIDLIQSCDEITLNQMEQKILKKHPNTYTFSKRLAEIIAWDYGKKLPIVICRPSIVMPSLKEPVPGWFDTYTGVIGLLIAGGKGIVRSAIIDRNNIPQIVPVDIADNSVIVCGWFRTTSTFSETPIYNITYSNIMKHTWGDLIDRFRELAFEYPFKRFLWYPVCTETTNIWRHNIIVLLFHMIPAFFIDFLLIIFMQRPFMVRTQNRFNMGMKLLQYFGVRSWTFSNTELMKIKGVLTEYDSQEFYLFEEYLDLNAYIQNCFFGVRKFLLHESCDNLFFQKTIYRILMCLEYAGRITLSCACLWFCLNTFHYVYNLIFG